MQTERAYDLSVLSLGAGVQSTALYVAMAKGRIERPASVAIFADTQQEPPWVYENLERLERLGGPKIIRSSFGDLGHGAWNGSAFVPFWTTDEHGNERPGRRSCTREYKIAVVTREIRRLLGLKVGQRAAGRFVVEESVGISIDEASRAKPKPQPWIHTRWPLLELGWNRWACKQYLESVGFPVPQKSACVFCPYRSPMEYAEWRIHHPELFEQACRWDEKIRSSGRGGQQYIWRKLRPLRELPSVEELSTEDRNQLNLFENECEGMCGV